MRSGPGILFAVIIFAIRVLLRNDFNSDEKDYNNYSIPTYQIPTYNLPSFSTFNADTPYVTAARLPTRSSVSNYNKTQTAIAKAIKEPSPTLTITPTSNDPADFTPPPPNATEPPFTRTPLPPSDTRLQCQITNHSAKAIPIYQAMDLDSTILAQLLADKSLLVYRESEDVDWVWIPDEQVTDIENWTFDTLYGVDLFGLTL